jgi:hypothetical protein
MHTGPISFWSACCTQSGAGFSAPLGASPYLTYVDA